MCQLLFQVLTITSKHVSSKLYPPNSPQQDQKYSSNIKFPKKIVISCLLKHLKLSWHPLTTLPFAEFTEKSSCPVYNIFLQWDNTTLDKLNIQYARCVHHIRCKVKVLVRRFLADSAVRAAWCRIRATGGATWWIGCFNFLAANHMLYGGFWSVARWWLALRSRRLAKTCSLNTIQSSIFYVQQQRFNQDFKLLSS